MQPNHANMDNLQCFNSLIFNSSKSPDSAKPKGKIDHPGRRHPRRVRGQTGWHKPVLYAAPPTKMVSMIKTSRRTGSQSLPAPTGRRRPGTCPRRRCSVRGAQGTGREPGYRCRLGPGTSDAQLGPSAVDDFTLGVLFVAKRDDRIAPTRVGTESGRCQP